MLTRHDTISTQKVKCQEKEKIIIISKVLLVQDLNLGNNDNRKDNKSIMCCFSQLYLRLFVYTLIRVCAV